MPDWIIAALNLLRPGLRLYLAITLAAGLFLFLPEGFLANLGVQELIKEHKAYLGISLVAFGCLSVIHVVEYAWHAWSGTVGIWWGRKRSVNAYRNLSLSEKAVLVCSTERHRKKFNAPINSRAIQSLVDKGIIECFDTTSNYGSYYIHPTMWSALNSVRDEVRRTLEKDESDVRQILSILSETEHMRLF